MDIRGVFYCIVGVFKQFLCSVIIYLIVCGACQALILTEETDAVKCRSGHVSFEFATRLAV